MSVHGETDEDAAKRFGSDVTDHVLDLARRVGPANALGALLMVALGCAERAGLDVDAVLTEVKQARRRLGS